MKHDDSNCAWLVKNGPRYLSGVDIDSEGIWADTSTERSGAARFDTRDAAGEVLAALLASSHNNFRVVRLRVKG